MKILIAGCEDDVFTHDQAMYMSRIGMEVTVFDLTHSQLYAQRGKQKILLRKYPTLSLRFRLLAFFYRVFTGIRLLHTFKEKADILQVLQVNYEYFLLFYFMKKKAGSTVITIYGSDFYGNSFRNYFLNLYLPDKITVASWSILNDIVKSYGSTIAKKMEVIPLFLSNLEKISFHPRKEIKAYEKLTVCCCSNASSNEQHEVIIDLLSSQGSRFRNRIRLLFLMTYGGDAEYNMRIKSLIKGKLQNWEVEVMDRFIESDEMVGVKNMVDIHINLRKTDALSGAMMESLAAGAQVITGSWLPYGGLINLGIKLYFVTNEDELPDMLSRCIEERSEYISTVAMKNSRTILKEYGHESLSRKWLNFYQSIVKDKR